MAGFQVHRFGDKVALCVLSDKGQTVYLDPGQALRLALALSACAADVDAQPKFSASTFATAHIEPSPLK